MGYTSLSEKFTLSFWYKDTKSILKAYPASGKSCFDLFYISSLYLNLIFVSRESPINLVFHSIDSHCLVFKKPHSFVLHSSSDAVLTPWYIWAEYLINQHMRGGKNAALCDLQSAIQLGKDLWAHSDTFIIAYKGGHFSEYHSSGICSFPSWLHHCHKEFQMRCWIGTFGF